MKRELSRPIKGIGIVLGQPKYLAIFIAASLLFAVFIYLSINWSFYGPLFRPMTFLPLLLMIVRETFVSVSTSLNGLIILLVSIFQGLAVTLLIYNYQTFNNLNKKATAGGAIATAGAVVGLGCVSCGTSLIIPIISLLFSSSSLALVNTANMFVLVLALILCVYSVYSIARKIQIQTFMSSLKKEVSNDV